MIRFTATGQDLRRTASLPDSASFTCCGWAIRRVDRGAYSTVFSMGDAASSASAEINLSTDSDGDTWGMYSSGNPGVVVAIGPTLTNDRAFFWAIVGSATGAGGNTAYHRWYEQVALTSQTNTAPGAFTEAIVMVGDNTYGDAWSGDIWNVMCWNRALTGAELLKQSYYRKPVNLDSLNFWWPMGRADVARDFGPNARHPTVTGTVTSVQEPFRFKDEFRRRTVIYAPSSSNTTRTPTVGALSFSGNSPTVTVSNASTITPGVGSLAFTGVAPNTTLTLPALGVGLILFSGNAPTLIRGTIISPSVGSLSLSGVAPSVLNPQTRTPTVGALTINGVAPGVVQGRIITPSVGALSISGVAPSLLQNNIVSPSVGALTLTGNSPNLNGQITITPSAGALSLTGLTPTLSVPRTITPSVGALTLTGLAPTVSTSAGATITPSAGTLTVTANNSTLISGLVIQPLTGAAVLVGGTSSLVISSPTIQPGAGSMSFTGIQPTTSNSSQFVAGVSSRTVRFNSRTQNIHFNR